MFLGQTMIKTFSAKLLSAANIVLTLLTYECMEGKQSGSRSGVV